MTRFAIDRNSDTPLHAQVAQWLRDDIRKRGLQAGSVLPSEAQLGERFGVARSVVRQALASLVTEGLIVRQAGRAPIVAPTREHHRLVQRSTGMFDQFAKSGVRLRTQVLALQSRQPPVAVAAFFGSNQLLLLERLRYVDDAPLALVHTWLPAHFAPLLAKVDLTDASLHGILQTHAGLRPGKGRNHIKAVAATPLQATQLDVAQGSPLLLLEGLGCDQNELPMEYFFTWHRGEHLVFDVDVTDDDEKVSRRLTSAGETAGAIPPALGVFDPAATLDSAATLDQLATPVADSLSADSSVVSGDADAVMARAESLLAQLSAELARLKATKH